MPTESVEQRKLAAIMFTDMVGYSALTQKDEALALKLLEEHRQLLRPLFRQHREPKSKPLAMLSWSNSTAPWTRSSARRKYRRF